MLRPCGVFNVWMFSPTPAPYHSAALRVLVSQNREGSKMRKSGFGGALRRQTLIFANFMICHRGEKDTRVLGEVVIIDFKNTLLMSVP